MDEILRNILISLKNIFIVIICVGFLGAGMLKMVELPELVAEFNYWGFPAWIMYVIGIIEIVLAIGVFYLPTRIPSLFAFIVLMTGALLVHIVYGEYNFLIAPIFLSTLCGIIIYLESRIVKNQ
jgi:putative oxidoreductase